MGERVCPWWVGYLLASPLRRLLMKPEELLTPYVETGMTVLDIGCAMGFFSLPLAKMVAPAGKVLALDLQPKMISVLNRRAQKAGVTDNIDARICGPDHLGGEDMIGKVDFALAFYMVHEVAERDHFLQQVHTLLAPQGRLFILEPKHHVSSSAFLKTEAAAQQAGFKTVGQPDVPGSRTVLMEKE